MDLANPLADISGSAYGDILGVLVRAREPLSGREIARRAGRSPRGATLVLSHLVGSAIVHRRDHPPASLFSLNDEHLAVAPLRALSDLWPKGVLELLRRHLDEWEPEALSVSIFGSLARGEADPDSDIDVLVLRSPDIPADHAGWEKQLGDLERAVEQATGNSTRILEFTADELQDDTPLRGELVRDALFVAGLDLKAALRTAGRRR